jgi:hypothetical protein
MSVTAVIAVMGVEPDEASRLRRRSGLIPLKVQHPHQQHHGEAQAKGGTP